jgi:transposase
MVGENDTRILRHAHHHVDAARVEVDMSHVTRIGIDETLVRRGQNYITLVMDMEAKRLPFGVEGRTHATLATFKADIIAHDGGLATVEEVCLDMSQSFIDGLRVNFPKVHLTFDRFNVMQKINKAVDNVRPLTSNP